MKEEKNIFIKRQLQIILDKSSFNSNEVILLSPLVLDLEELVSYVEDYMSEECKGGLKDSVYTLDDLLGLISLEERNFLYDEEVVLVENTLKKIRNLVINSDLWRSVKSVE
jgi:hypothetical protein